VWRRNATILVPGRGVREGVGMAGCGGGGGGATRLYVTMDVCVCSPTTKRVKRLLRGNMSLEALSPPCKSCP
jgi:hypothetical protein